MTRSGRIFRPSKNPVIHVRDQPVVENSQLKEKRKGKIMEIQPTQMQEQSENRELGQSNQNQEQSAVAKAGSRYDSEKLKPVKEPEADKFLKFFHNSEYKVVDQLTKLPAKISIMELLLNSEPHRKTVKKVLAQAYVANDVTINHLESI